MMKPASCSAVVRPASPITNARGARQPGCAGSRRSPAPRSRSPPRARRDPTTRSRADRSRGVKIELFVSTRNGVPWSRHCCSSSDGTRNGGVLVDEHAVHVGQPAFDVGAGPHAHSLSTASDPPTRAACTDRASGLGSKSWRERRRGTPNSSPTCPVAATSSPGRTQASGTSPREQLVRAGARVYMTGRSPNRLMAARAAVRRRVPDAGERVETLLLDTSNLGSVRAAAATIGGRGALDGLLLNAGIVHPPKERETTGGRPRGRLRDERARPLRSGGRPAGAARPRRRVAWCGSAACRPRCGSTTRSTRSSSRATRAGARTCSRRSPAPRSDSKPTGACARPGCRSRASSRTRATRRAAARPGSSASTARPGSRGSPTTCSSRSRSPRSTARGPSCALSSTPTIEGGEFWGPRLVARGEPHQGTASKITRDPEIAERLWGVCEDATGVRWPFAKAAKAAKD